VPAQPAAITRASRVNRVNRVSKANRPKANQVKDNVVKLQDRAADLREPGNINRTRAALPVDKAAANAIRTVEPAVADRKDAHNQLSRQTFGTVSRLAPRPCRFI
jgi:hypothetical protein